MDNKQFVQLVTILATQNILLAKLLIRIDSGIMPSDDQAFELAQTIQTKAVNAVEPIS